MHCFTRKKCYAIIVRVCNCTVFSDCINELDIQNKHIDGGTRE